MRYLLIFLFTFSVYAQEPTLVGGIETIDFANQEPSQEGEFIYDTDISGLDKGALSYHNGTEVRYLVDLDQSPVGDGSVVTYDSSGNKFRLKSIKSILERDPLSFNDITLGSITSTGSSTFTVANVLASDDHGVKIYTDTAQTASELFKVHTDNSSTTYTNVSFINDGNGDGLQLTQNNAAIAFHIINNAGGNSIEDDSGAILTAVGVWTDAPSCHREKLNVEEIDTSYLTKLKNLKLFRFQKKREVYGAKKDKKYSKKKKRTDAPFHIGYVLDDPSTPEELISRDLDGEINGISPSQGVTFLLGVCKELLARIEELEKS